MPIRTNVQGRSGGVGSVKFFPGITTPPSGYVLADGSVHDFGELPALDAAWGVTPDTAAGNVPEGLAYVNMTATTTGDQTASAKSRDAAGFYPWYAFRTAQATASTDCWASLDAPTTANPQWLQLSYASKAHYITRFRIQVRAGATDVNIVAPPKLIVMQGSVDGIYFADLTDQLTIPQILNGAFTGYYQITKNRGAYKIFRLVVYERYGTETFVCVSRLQLFEGSLPGTYALPSLVDANDSGIYCVKTS